MPEPLKTGYDSLGSTFASPWYLRVDDNIRVTSYNALAAVRLEVRYRFVDCEGRIQASQEAQVPNTDRTAKSSVFATPEGWLLGGEVFVSGAAPLIGQTYVVVEIVRGLGSSALPLQVIAAGYVSAKQPLPFPGTQITSSVDCGGAVRSITGSTPAAGAEISETVPTGARWELLSFFTLFTTSAGAANRLPAFFIQDTAPVTFFFDQMSGAEVAATAYRNVWAQGVTANAGLTTAAQRGSLPVGNRLAAGFNFGTVTANIQAGDQYSNVRYLVREWLEGA